MLAGGPEVAAFEDEFGAFVGTEHAVAVGSGTAALLVGLMALGIGRGDEVIVPSFTFAATANVVRICGAEPVFVDIDPSTYCIDPAAVTTAVTDRTVAIMPVHLYGHPADLVAIQEIADRHGLAVAEDAAQAHGATLQGRGIGSWGSFGAFSFYPTKNMTTGEGGMITTNDAHLAERARWIRNQGMSVRYQHEVVGLNERMTAVEGAIGRVQLRRLPDWTKARQENAAFYDATLDGAYGLPVVAEAATHVYHQYTIRCPNRAAVIDALERAEVGHGIYYPAGTHLQKPYAASAPSLPVTERVSSEVVSIPVRPDLTPDERDRVAGVLNAAVGA
jgi:dTDP-4-amino-4,6-dideoxygalactose transaminase